mmetsp:Transcript_69606/g.123184  ORF Transcript_69606/g.123184 Transcript_69606/m.123184 type:complete len:535 (+) Transcript_69606:44-1648(+)|eukprot:CAMPEP_0197626584 /NCGR_PEP_ID=MMETSP1338-20131121/5481_1 /TAXON_ID=43686 ORGANISM="Pelagodinium beii, Strain RCC1491" /NCGR_SAMPLE_ID=MMETSP1338 /ASSEMBLY_ACC=CAM_ASM_000754 /LENGTH=534 /DNA_ID=CAMNT_0043197127 /DNA_START=44 /DNA_END=1648 /DNA_ORIENTATION=+
MASAAAPPKRSLLGLLGSSRAAKAHLSAERCGRCKSALEGDDQGASLHCSCGLSLHSGCAYPPLSEAVAAVVSSWNCNACRQQQNLEAEQAHDSFCCACGSSRLEELVPCCSCRASFHADCSPGKSLCPSCSKARSDQESGSSVCLEQWSLELVGQEGLDPVPAVRGLRLDSPTPGALWRTSEIVHTVDSRTLVTRMGQVVLLRGPLCKRLAEKLKLPRQLIESFKAGFPCSSWLVHIRYAVRGKDLSKALEKKAPRRRAPPKRQAAPEVWSDAQHLALQQVLREVRPSEANYWQVVAAKLGRTSEECRRQAFGESAETIGPQRTRKAKRKDVEKENEDLNYSDDELVTARVLPAKDGPRQVKRVRALLNATSFGASKDFLDFRSKDEAAGQKGLEAPSPSSLDFLGSLHTGCTPPEPERRPLVESPNRGERRRLDFGEAEAAAGEDFDSSWAPKGLDSFICEVRSRRKVSGPEALRASKPARQERKSAQDLLREVDCKSQSASEESDEEDFAPIAVVPQLGAPIASSPEEEDD